jgi:hypothetical protein
LKIIELFPDGIRQLGVEVDDVPATVVGYAVAERDPGAQPRCRLVTPWHDIATVRLDTAVSLS